MLAGINMNLFTHFSIPIDGTDLGSTSGFLQVFVVGRILNVVTRCETATFISKKANLIAMQFLGPKLNAKKL